MLLVELVELIDENSGFFTQIFDGTVYYFRLLSTEEKLTQKSAAEVKTIFQVAGKKTPKSSLTALEHDIFDIKYCPKLEFLFIYCIDKSQNGKIIKIEFAENRPKNRSNSPNPNFSPTISKLTPLRGSSGRFRGHLLERTDINQTMFLKKFRGSPRPGNTIFVGKNDSHLVLLQGNELIRVFTDIEDFSGFGLKGKQYSSEIPINMKQRVTSVLSYDEDKLLVLTNSNKLKLVKFSTFGHSEVISENSGLADTRTDHLEGLSMCPRGVFIVIIDKKLNSGFDSILVLKCKKEKNLIRKGYKIKLELLFKTSVGLQNSSSIFVNIPFYFENLPLLSIAEVSRDLGGLTLYTVAEDRCRKLNSYGLKKGDKVIGLKSRNCNLLKINYNGDVMRVRLRV